MIGRRGTAAAPGAGRPQGATTWRLTAPRASIAAVVVAALLGGTAAAEAQSPRDHLVVEVDALADRLSDSTLVLLHVGPEEAYAAGHIPGARYIELSDIAAQEDHAGGTRLSLELPEPGALERRLEALGIGDGSRVVVYWDDGWVTPATRVVFTLDWIGLGNRTSLLNGGLDAWRAAGRAVTSEAPPPAVAADLTPRPDPDLAVTADWVAAHRRAPGYRLIDARAPVHYDGIQATYLHRDPVRKGHIPGAANIPVSSFIDDDHRIRPEAELRALFEGAGVAPGDTIVGYCHLGQFATLLLFSARTLGYPVKLYDGSFQEWGSRSELPVEGPEAGSAGAPESLGPGMEPAWTADGRWIAVSVLDGAQRDLVLVDPRSRERRRLTRTDASELLPSWSTDDRLAYVEPSERGIALRVVDDPLLEWVPKLVEVRHLTPSFVAAPWAPGGDALTVVAGDYPETEIYRVPLDGSDPAPLVVHPGHDGAPAWAADGRLAFVSDREGSRDIWVLEEDGSARRVTTNEAREDHPTWSPNGRWIAFVSDRDGDEGIYAVPAAGGTAVRLSGESGPHGYPAWSTTDDLLAHTRTTRGRGNDELFLVHVPAALRGGR